jgi:hypothetical protein
MTLARRALRSAYDLAKQLERTRERERCGDGGREVPEAFQVTLQPTRRLRRGSASRVGPT